jgi:hypothetical protein
MYRFSNAASPGHIFNLLIFKCSVESNNYIQDFHLRDLSSRSYLFTHALFRETRRDNRNMRHQRNIFL